MPERNLQIPRPWEVPYEEFSALLTSQKPTTEEKRLAVKLTARLDNGRKYGHVVAKLYTEWKAAQGRDAVVAWWAAYDKRVSELAASEEEEFVSPPKPAAVPTKEVAPWEGENEFATPKEVLSPESLLRIEKEILQPAQGDLFVA